MKGGEEATISLPKHREKGRTSLPVVLQQFLHSLVESLHAVWSDLSMQLNTILTHLTLQEEREKSVNVLQRQRKIFLCWGVLALPKCR